jgi:hypothetical protein
MSTRKLVCFYLTTNNAIMSFGTPQRVLNLKREHEKSLRALGTYSGEKFNDNLDTGYEDMAGFGGYHRHLDHNTGNTGVRNLSRTPAIRSNSPHGGRARSPTSFMHANSDGDEEDKNNTIAQLQQEVDRLRGKVNKVVESAETSLQEAIDAQEALRISYNAKLDKKELDVEHIRVENVVLKAQIEDLRAELAILQFHVIPQDMIRSSTHYWEHWCWEIRMSTISLTIPLMDSRNTTIGK